MVNEVDWLIFIFMFTFQGEIENGTPMLEIFVVQMLQIVASIAFSVILCDMAYCVHCQGFGGG